MNFWDHQRARFLKKTKYIACDVTVGTNKIKIICANKVSVQLSYDAHFKWNMRIWEKICHAEQKEMPFLGPRSEKISKAKKQI